MNKVQMIGRLAKDPELRFTPNGKAVTTMIIAVDKPFGDKQSDFFKVQVWNKLAESSAQYLAKGRQVGISGRLEQKMRDVKDTNGYNVYDNWITAESVYFLGANPNSNQNDHQQNYDGYDSANVDGYNQNFGGQQQENNQIQSQYGQNQNGRMNNSQQNRSAGKQQQHARINDRQQGSNNSSQFYDQRGSRNPNNVANYNREYDQRYGDMEAQEFSNDDLPF